MSIETDLMTSVTSVIDFIKTQVGLTLVEANNKKIIKIDKETLRKVNSLVDASIQASFIKASGEISSIAKSIQSQKTLETTHSTSGRSKKSRTK